MLSSTKTYHGKAGDFLYRNIVFDLGGVVINYNPKDYLVDKFFHEKTEKKLYEATFGSPEWERMDSGEMSWTDAARIFRKRGQEKNVAFEMQALLDDWTEMLSTRNATVALMKLMRKKGFDLYYLSNISRETFKVLEGRDFWRMFKGGLASYELNITKPNPAIYRALLSRYNLVPEETIFTDDNKANVAGAFEVGITGIQFESVKSFVKLLVNYGIDL